MTDDEWAAIEQPYRAAILQHTAGQRQMAKTEYMAFLMEPKEKRELEVKAFEARLTQGEVIRRALAFYFASVLSKTNQIEQDVEVEGAPA